MVALQPKTNELIIKLSDSITTGQQLLNDIELRGVIRDARLLPDLPQAIGIEGLCLILKGDLDDGYRFCEKAIFLAPHEAANWLNYTTLLSNIAKHNKQMGLLTRAIKYQNPDVARYCMIMGAFWADYDLMLEANMVLSKMQLAQNDDIQPYIRVFNLLENKAEITDDLKKTAQVVMDIAEEEGLLGINSYIEDDNDGILSFNLVVDVNDTSHISVLNEKIIQRMVEVGLETSNCVAFFEAKAEACL